MEKNNRINTKVAPALRFKVLIAYIFLVFVVGWSSCIEEDKLLDTNYVPVTVETSEVTQITSNSAIIGGVISAPQNRNVMQGVCWSKRNNPTINDYFINKQGVIGAFSFNLTGLQSGTTYYIRAYTTIGANFGNGSETVYGTQISFTTSTDSQTLEYSYDDGISNDGWGYESNSSGWMGNLFPVSDHGIITSVKVYFTDVKSSTEYLLIDFYDSNRNLIGTSNNFKPTANSWIDIPINNIPFNGAFYVMVRWTTTSSGFFYLGLDNDGNNVYQDLAYYMNNGDWLLLSQYSGYNGIFLMRVAATLNSTNKKAIIYNSKDYINPECGIKKINLPINSHISKK